MGSFICEVCKSKLFTQKAGGGSGDSCMTKYQGLNDLKETRLINHKNIGNTYQPSGARGTSSPPTTLQRSNHDNAKSGAHRPGDNQNVTDQTDTVLYIIYIEFLLKS